MAHEIRNPLGVIRNSTYFLNMKLKDNKDKKVKEQLDIITYEISNADKIITDILDFARLQKPTLEEENINDIIKEALSKSDIPETMDIKMCLGGKLPKVAVDAKQIKQVFLNLISNAVQATIEGELKIKSREKDGFIIIDFKDTGGGITKENTDKIFDALFSTKIKGIGLGLVACKNIIEGHKGKIEVESKEGKGATFTIKLLIHRRTGLKK